MTSLPKRIKQSAQLSGSFVLRSGKVSDTYFDKYQFESDPNLLLEIANQMKDLIPTHIEVLAGLEMGGIPLVTILSQVTKIPAAFIRKQAKEYGTCKYAEGASLTGKQFVLIEDVVSSGGALIDTLAKLKEDNLFPELAICVIDRRPVPKSDFIHESLQLKALFTFSDIESA